MCVFMCVCVYINKLYVYLIVCVCKHIFPIFEKWRQLNKDSSARVRHV